MSKKSKDPWNRFVSGLLKRKRAKRNHTLPKEYLLSVADSLWRTTPSKEIIYNTLVDVAETMFNKGYDCKGSDASFFKRKQTQRMEASFKEFRDNLEDIIHSKNICK